MGIFGKIISTLSGAGGEPLPDDATLIDVRSAEEFASGHVEGAVALPLNRLAQGIGAVAPDKTRPVIVYCASGARSAMARRQLLDMGYQSVTNGGGVRALASRMQRAIVA